MQKMLYHEHSKEDLKSLLPQQPYSRGGTRQPVSRPSNIIRMKWSTHINKVARKAQSTLGFLRRNLRHCTENCRKTAYIAMVRSVLEYGSTIWDPYQKGDIIKLERIQRKAIRFIKHDYRTREEGCINKMAAELGLPTLENRRKCLRLVLLYNTTVHSSFNQ